jgi:hypothetical protein
MSFKLFACGDVVNSSGRQDFVNKELKKLITNCDVSICNFEAPIKTNFQLPINKVGPHVFQSKESVRYLNDVGFNFVSLANNHIYDYGEEGLKETLSELSKYKFRTVGGGASFEDSYSSEIIEKGGVKVALLAACENEFGCLYEEAEKGGYAWLFHPVLEDSIRALNTQVDVIILVAHAGVENINFPIKEWRDRYKRLCDIGVDVVIGHHPHVPQGFEQYKKSTIFYSLGNFYFDTAGYEQKSDDSYSVILELSAKGLERFEIVYHKKILGQTCLLEKHEVNFSITALNELLVDNYAEKNNEMCIELFYKYYFSYYQDALGVLSKNTSIIKRFKRLVIKYFLRDRAKNYRNLLLLHNIKIDSHRFVVQRALSLISEDINVVK